MRYNVKRVGGCHVSFAGVCRAVRHQKQRRTVSGDYTKRGRAPEKEPEPHTGPPCHRRRCYMGWTEVVTPPKTEVEKR
jgi:hypothetical protein